MEPDLLLKRVRRARRGARTSREAPYVIYPEILVIVDYDGYRLHGGDNVQIKRYFVSFWNGVDLRYKLLKGPKIRISIAGIIISRKDDLAGTECEDKVTDIAGSMTCREFLSHYGFQYCSYRYMQQNCCKSQKEVCEGRNWRKRK
ncbi:uncharacterized protein GBIM_06092 [Gryllus bimaculatus]|nr:uncharacterized protein GBIM_06092 [Gryllus bimaculatus]